MELYDLLSYCYWAVQTQIKIHLGLLTVSNYGNELVFVNKNTELNMHINQYSEQRITHIYNRKPFYKSKLTF